MISPSNWLEVKEEASQHRVLDHLMLVMVPVMVKESAEFAAAFGKRLSSALRRKSTESGRAHVTSVLNPVNIADRRATLDIPMKDDTSDELPPFKKLLHHLQIHDMLLPAKFQVVPAIVHQY